MGKFFVSNGSQVIQQIPKLVQRSWPKMREVLKANWIAACGISGFLTALGLFGISCKPSSPPQIPTQETAPADTTNTSEKPAEAKLSRWEQFKRSAHKSYQSAS